MTIITEKVAGEWVYEKRSRYFLVNAVLEYFYGRKKVFVPYTLMPGINRLYVRMFLLEFGYEKYKELMYAGLKKLDFDE